MNASITWVINNKIKSKKEKWKYVKVDDYNQRNNKSMNCNIIKSEFIDGKFETTFFMILKEIAREKVKYTQKLVT